MISHSCKHLLTMVVSVDKVSPFSDTVYNDALAYTFILATDDRLKYIKLIYVRAHIL